MTIKMGLRCFLVLVFIVVHSSSALECHNVFSIETTTCDACIGCGGVWCNDLSEVKHCKPSNEVREDWCLNNREIVGEGLDSKEDGPMFSPQWEHKLTEINTNKVTDIRIIGNPSVKGSPIPYANILNTTSTEKIRVNVEMVDSIIKVTTRVKDGFCSSTSGKFEYVVVEVGLRSVPEKAVLKYHVPCACGCSEEVIEQAPTCNGFGNLTCGACQCDDKWKGQFCEKCPDRGDTSQSCLTREGIQCSNNGFCDACNKCECFKDKPGSQYFEPDNDCRGLCTIINESDCLTECLKNNTLGYCNPTCEQDGMYQYDETLLEQRDDANRTIWVKCSTEQNMVYWAAQFVSVMTRRKTIHMMRDEHTESKSLVPLDTPSGVTIPVVGTLVALLVAAVAAAAVYVMWKGHGALPTASPNYANIDPEDSVGVNPLYKSPMSSFKNPTYAAKS